MKITTRYAWIVLVCVGFATFAPASDDKSAEVKLKTVKWQGYLDEVNSHKKAKLIIVDAWATWCVPCMKNFPHLVEMSEKYADKGLVALSLSLDEADKTSRVEAVTAFLKEKHATFTNLILDERNDEAFEKLNISAIPAVFIYTPDGQELKRFTLEDVDKPFTYQEVETFVKDYLDGKKPK
jgi:thiol-disulfide isomerase/thioredoxin